MVKEVMEVAPLAAKVMASLEEEVVVMELLPKAEKEVKEEV